MKYTNFRAFEKHLEGAYPNHFASLYMIISKEPFECKDASGKLSAQLLKGQLLPELNLKHFDAENLDLNTLLSELSALSLFSGKQVIILQNADKLTAPARTSLEAFIEKPSPNIFLIITAASVNHATNFYKKAEKHGVILEIPEQKPWEKEKSIAEWVGSQAASEGKQMSSLVCQLLIKQIGTDLNMLSSELEKLYCFVGDRTEITISDIGAICSSVDLSSIWQLGEAIFRREGGAALRITKAMLNDGSNFISVLKQIRFQFQTEFQVCSLLASGGTANDINQRFPYMRGNILDRHMQMAQTYGLKSFKQGMKNIDAIEIMAKNSAADHNTLAELLIAKLIVANG